MFCFVSYLVVIRLGAGFNQVRPIKGLAALHVPPRLAGHEANQIQVAVDHFLQAQQNKKMWW